MGHSLCYRSSIPDWRQIGCDHWVEGFRCELKVEAINRIGLQLVFAAQFPLAYIARINGTIERLLDLYR